MIVHNPNNLPTIPIADLLPSQGNLKDLSETNYKKLKNTIERRGFSYPVYVWEDDNKILHLLDGHQRQRVLMTEGWNEPIPYLKVPAKNLQEAMARLLEITSQYATITQEGIDEFIATYELNESEVYDATSFDALNKYGDDEEVEIEEDEAPEVSTEPAISELGEIYQLGRHRVMCGDSTVKENVDALMGGVLADMVFTDPPYGVDYSSKKLGNIMNDTFKDDSLYQFIYDSFASILDYIDESCGVYCWYEDKFRSIIQTAIEDSGYEYKQNLIWNKGMNLSGADYQKAHENCLYCQVKGQKASWFGGRDKKTILGKRRKDFIELKKQDLLNIVLNMQKESTVWDIDRDVVTTYVHPTQKPVGLCARAIGNSSDDDGNVLDIFMGSGSTLIACEQTNRICYGMELDPKYVDVIRKRYWKFVNDNNEDGWEDGTPAIAQG